VTWLRVSGGLAAAGLVIGRVPVTLAARSDGLLQHLSPRPCFLDSEAPVGRRFGAMTRSTKVWTVGSMLAGLILAVGVTSFIVPLLLVSVMLAAGVLVLTSRLARPRS
jgi:hypothetical protein